VGGAAPTPTSRSAEVVVARWIPGHALASAADRDESRSFVAASGLPSRWSRCLEEALLQHRKVGEVDDAVAVQVRDRVGGEESLLHDREIGEVHDAIVVEVGVAEAAHWRASYPPGN